MKTLVCCLGLLIAYSLTSDAQELSGGRPYSFKLKNLTDTIPIYHLPNYSNEYLAKYADSANTHPGEYVFGKAFEIKIDIISEGSKRMIKRKNVYRYRICSEHALSLTFYFYQYYIPQGARLFLYSPDKKIVYGSFTRRNNPSAFNWGIQLMTPELPGNDWILEYNVPVSKNQGKLILGMVGHRFR